MRSFAERAIDFYRNLRITESLPDGVEVLNPYADPRVDAVVDRFFRKFYREGRDRTILLGINPGRFGAGVTGITFTDPVRLEEECGIDNPFRKRSELSSRFIYEVIRANGGVGDFFSGFFLSAVSPLGFTRSGRNLNYYDDRALEIALKGFISRTMQMQCALGIRRDRAICLGEGRNYNYLRELNREQGWFGEIIPLPHPRWVMQYRFRQREDYVKAYLEAIRRHP